jgi:hypothetical protein
VDFMTTFATAGQVLKTLKVLASMGKAIDTAEFKLKIADLSEAMADLKLAHIEAKDDLAKAGAEIERLKKQLQRTANLVEFRGYKSTRTRMVYRLGRPIVPFASRKKGCCSTFPISWATVQAFVPHASQGSTLCN